MNTNEVPQAEFEAFSATRKKQESYISRFLAKHQGHDVSESEFQGCTQLMCHNQDCDEDYIIVN